MKNPIVTDTEKECTIYKKPHCLETPSVRFCFFANLPKGRGIPVAIS